MTKTFIGSVVSAKMAKTVVVAVESARPHPLYRKMVKKTKKFKAHNENLELKIGDRVKITETKPISREKHFKVTEVVSR